MLACRVMKRLGGVDGLGRRSVMGLWVTPGSMYDGLEQGGEHTRSI